MNVEKRLGRLSASSQPTPRKLFMVLSPRSLSYARPALDSLYCNAIEPFELTLITDTAEDKDILKDELDKIRVAHLSMDQPRVFNEGDLSEREQEKFSNFPRVMAFRRGHPCWRKITDPILLSDDGDEIVVLDPDIYFPTRFSFEQSLASKLLLMWQLPSCLLPADVVYKAMQSGIELAHHTDIGVAQWTMPVDLAWLDWLLVQLGGQDIPRSMHVESIVWAALAMRMGGGYLNRNRWLCWRRTQFKRVLKKLGVPGATILRAEPWNDIKCFHAGGEAKWWIEEARSKGYLDVSPSSSSLADEGPHVPLPFVRLEEEVFEGLERRRRWLERVGYYSLFSAGA